MNLPLFSGRRMFGPCAPVRIPVSSGASGWNEMKEKRILLAVGEPARRESLTARLQHANFAMATAVDGRQAIEIVRELVPDMAMIDCNLPDMTAPDLVVALRAAHKLPILVLTDSRTNWQDSLRVLGAGANNTLHESRFVELEEHIENLLREWVQPVMTHGSIVLDKATGTAEYAGGPLELTAFEYKVLTFLVAHAGEWVSAQAIADHLYREEYDRIAKVAAEFVRRLERKMDPDGSRKPIATSEQGYRLVV
jgi:two-component system response regulator PhoP